MLRINITTFTIYLLLIAMSSCQSSSQFPVEKLNKLAFINANVIPMTKDTILTHHAVIIKDGRIEKVCAMDKATITKDYRCIDIEGMYLMPGLTDMHVHVSDKKDLMRFLSHAVTTIRNMSDLPWWAKLMGFPSILKLRNQQEKGIIMGPRIFTCGMTLDGNPPVSPMNQRITTIDEARQVVIREKAQGYDAIKIYDNLTLDVYQAIMEEAQHCNMPVAGHAPHAVPLDTILTSALCSIEHLTGYIDNKRANYAVDTSQLEHYIELTRTSGIYNVPTLTIWASLPQPNGLDAIKKDPRYNDLAWNVRWMWRTALPYYYDIDYSPKENYAKHMLEITSQLTKRLHDAGCPLLIGTDSNIAGTYVGDATLLEMELFVKAGISEYETLRSATILPAKALRIGSEAGTIEEYKLASIIILKDNPLNNISHLRKLKYVYNNGDLITK